MKILLNVLGILIFFLNRFAGRKDKTAPVTAKFWLKDNWEQLVCVGLIDVALMLLVFQGGLQVNFERLAPMLPEGVQLTGDSAVCLLVGMIFSWAGYVGYKKLFKE
jgi:hypothetical protein